MDTSRMTRAPPAGSNGTNKNEMSHLMSNLFKLDRTLNLLHAELKKKNKT